LSPSFPYTTLFRSLDLDGVDRLQSAGGIADELGGLNGVPARILAPERFALLLAVIEAIDFGPLRPGVVVGALQGRHGDDFQLDQALAALAQGGADAIGARVAAADHHHVLIFGRN